MTRLTTTYKGKEHSLPITPYGFKWGNFFLQHWVRGINYPVDLVCLWGYAEAFRSSRNCNREQNI